jgi:hypothetical protein
MRWGFSLAEIAGKEAKWLVVFLRWVLLTVD